MINCGCFKPVSVGNQALKLSCLKLTKVNVSLCYPQFVDSDDMTNCSKPKVIVVVVV